MNKEKVYLSVIVLLAIALIAGCAQQAQQTKRLSISEIVIPKEGLKFISEEGKLIATMSAGEYGGELTIRNNQGNLVAVVGGTEYGGLLGISSNNQEKLAVSMAAFEYGGGLIIFNNQEMSVAGMSAYQDGGRLGIYDNQGNRLWAKP